MNRFQQCSVRERYLTRWFLAQAGIKDADFTDEFGYERHDLTFYDGSVIAEVKVRDKASTDPYFRLTTCDYEIDPRDPKAYFRLTSELRSNPVCGYLLEKKKYDYLMGLLPAARGAILYINFFTDGAVKVFRLDDRPEPKWQVIGCPRQTCGDNTRIGKQCAKLTQVWKETVLREEFRPS